MSATQLFVKPLFQYRFGSAAFDEARFELTVAGLVVEVEHKPLEVLALLLAHAGEVVTKEELLSVVWAGRPTVDGAVTNALAKLRDALGDDNAAHVVTVSRVGYRLTGSVKRLAVGRVAASVHDLKKGDAVPLRPDFQLNTLLNSSPNSEVWLARHVRTKEQRIYKFSPDGERLSTLKREVTLYRLLRDTLGTRDDLVRILDWNFETSPFFIECEYGGVSLTEWSNGNNLKLLSSPERIELFLQIADVLAAAHDVGVLHKDIKPANVLITPNSDSAWRIRLTDFGSGRVLDPQRIADLGITQLGLTMTAAVNSDDNTGTVLYLAPELLAHQAPTIQSDVYALGILLYQLMIGDLRKPMVSGWEREIEDELLRDDIRAATEGNPTHRLNSVHTLIERLRALAMRHQQLREERDAQLIAKQSQDTLRRAQTRRPWVLATGVLLIIGIVVSSVLYVHALQVQRQLLQSKLQTEKQAARVGAVTEFLNNDVLGRADPFSGESAQHNTVKEAVEGAAARLDGKFNNDPMTEASIRMTLGDIFNKRGDGVAAEIQWRRAMTLLTSNAATLVLQVRCHYGLAHALLAQSKFDQAATLLTDTDHLRLQHGMDDPQFRLMSHEGWGRYFYSQQKATQAIPHFEQVLQLLRAQVSPNLDAIDRLRISLGDCYISVNRLTDAEHLFHDLVDELKQRRNPSDLMLVSAEGMYGQALLYQHRYQSAGPWIEQSYQAIVAALGKRHPLALDALNLRCSMYSMTKQLERALQCTQESYELLSATWGDHHWLTLAALVGVGQSQYALNHYVIATRILKPVSAELTRTIGSDNPTTQAAEYFLARSMLQLHQVNQAQLIMLTLDAKALEGYEPGAPWVTRLQLLHGMVLLAQGHRSEALSLLQPATQLHDDVDPTDTILQEARHALHRAGYHLDGHELVTNGTGGTAS